MSELPIRASVSDGNTKLGRLPNWSIEINEETCPGATRVCQAHCYGKHGHFLAPIVRSALHRNYLFSKTPQFSGWMKSKLSEINCSVFRIHVTGDFYSVEYIDKWAEIIRSLPGIQFLVYTRSWRIPQLRHRLLDLARNKNLYLWFSADSECWHNARPWKGIRWAYMAVDDDDALWACSRKLQPDLVFRVRCASPLKEVQGVLVCPEENGVKGVDLSCMRCQLCWCGKQVDPRSLRERNADWDLNHMILPVE